jgi:hypothetical protein
MSAISAVAENRLPHEHLSSELSYWLVAGSVSLEPMRILEKHEETWGGWVIRFYVLGGSHAMQLTRPGSTVTEILSCISPTLIDIAAPNKVAPNAAGQIDIADGCEIQASLENLVINLNVVKCRISDTVRASSACDGALEHAFEVPGSSESAWTRLRWRIMARELVLETEHTYPQEGIRVLSETTVRELSAYGREDFVGE